MANLYSGEKYFGENVMKDPLLGYWLKSFLILHALLFIFWVGIAVGPALFTYNGNCGGGIFAGATAPLNPELDLTYECSLLGHLLPMGILGLVFFICSCPAFTPLAAGLSILGAYAFQSIRKKPA